MQRNITTTKPKLWPPKHSVSRCMHFKKKRNNKKEKQRRTEKTRGGKKDRMVLRNQAFRKPKNSCWRSLLPQDYRSVDQMTKDTKVGARQFLLGWCTAGMYQSSTWSKYLNNRTKYHASKNTCKATSPLPNQNDHAINMISILPDQIQSCSMSLPFMLVQARNGSFQRLMQISHLNHKTNNMHVSIHAEQHHCNKTKISTPTIQYQDVCIKIRVKKQWWTERQKGERG